MVLPRPGVELAFPGRNDALRVHAGAQVHERGGGALGSQPCSSARGH
jgi:hypothetical protein